MDGCLSGGRVTVISKVDRITSIVCSVDEYDYRPCSWCHVFDRFGAI